VAIEGRELEVFSKMSDYVGKFFHTDEVQKIMEYQLVFWDLRRTNTPALYNIMSHIDFSMGVWYPMGGIHEIPLALQRIGLKHGAKYLVTVSRRAHSHQARYGKGALVYAAWLESGEN
jgi:phytoene desaturase